MFESKVRTGLHSDDAEAFGISRRSGRHVPSHDDDDGLPNTANLRAANAEDPRDTELRAILRRRLNGDPYPVSSRKGLPENEAAAEQASEPVPDLLEYVPDLLEGMEEPAPPPASPLAHDTTPRVNRWSLSIPAFGFVIAAALTGAAIPTLLAPPPRYASQAVLHAEGDGRVRQGLLDVAARRVVAPSVLSDVVARMKLDRDPEFTGSRTGALGVAVDLLSGNGNASDAPSRAQASLRKAIALDMDGQTGLLRLVVTTEDPARSADIANRLAIAILYDTAIAKAASASLVAETPADRSRKELDRASAALAEFKAHYGEDKIAAAMALQQQRQLLDGQMKAVDQAVSAAKARLAAAKTATPASVLSGDLASAGLDDLRSRYSAAKAQLAQLSVQLGPRHPRLLAQQATVDDLAVNMRSQLQRLVVSSEADVKAALEKQAALSAQMASASQAGSDVDLGRLAQLQDAVKTAQGRYDADQQSAAITEPEARPPLTVLSQAVASAAPLDDHIAGNQAIGLFAGLVLAFGAVFLRKWMTSAELAEDESADEDAVSAVPPVHHESAASVLPWPDDDFQPSAGNGSKHESPSDIADEWVRIQQELASLRVRVETYASRRHPERG